MVGLMRRWGSRVVHEALAPLVTAVAGRVLALGHLFRGIAPFAAHRVRREHGFQHARRFLSLVDQQLLQADHAAGRVAGAHHVFLAPAHRPRARCRANSWNSTLAPTGCQVGQPAEKPAAEPMMLMPVAATEATIACPALRGVAGIDVAQFVTEQGGQFGLVVQIDQDAARHAHRPAGEGIGIDVVGIQHAVGVRHLRPVRLGVEPVADLAQVLVDRRILHRAEILRELLRRHLAVDRLFLVLIHADQGMEPPPTGEVAQPEAAETALAPSSQSTWRRVMQLPSRLVANRS